MENTEQTPILLTRRKIGFFFLLGLMLWVTGRGYFFYLSLDTPYRAPGASAHVFVEKGLGARQISRHLAQEGHVPSRWHFLVATWLEEAAGGLQAGEYDASGPHSPRQWVRMLEKGQRILHRVTVPDAWTTEQIDRRMASAGLLRPGQFQEAAADPEILAEFGIEAPNAEGYLFPETYAFEKPLTANRVVEAMLRQFQRESEALGGLSHEDVVLASILTKEARQYEDLIRASTVFHNRLDRGMGLESDATVVYAQKRKGLPAFPLDRTLDSPYNTYKEKGLPPYPICNPGRDSLRAAKYPAEGDWLYFLSDDAGTFYFTRTHREHVRKKRELRRAGSSG
jgi:UPF0755 protein